MVIFIFHGKCFKDIEKMKSRFFLESGPIPLIYGCSDLVPGITDPDLADLLAILVCWQYTITNKLTWALN